MKRSWHDISGGAWSQDSPDRGEGFSLTPTGIIPSRQPVPGVGFFPGRGLPPSAGRHVTTHPAEPSQAIITVMYQVSRYMLEWERDLENNLIFGIRTSPTTSSRLAHNKHSLTQFFLGARGALAQGRRKEPDVPTFDIVPARGNPDRWDPDEPLNHRRPELQYGAVIPPLHLPLLNYTLALMAQNQAGYDDAVESGEALADILNTFFFMGACVTNALATNGHLTTPDIRVFMRAMGWDTYNIFGVQPRKHDKCLLIIRKQAWSTDPNALTSPPLESYKQEFKLGVKSGTVEVENTAGVQWRYVAEPALMPAFRTPPVGVSPEFAVIYLGNVGESVHDNMVERNGNVYEMMQDISKIVKQPKFEIWLNANGK